MTSTLRLTAPEGALLLHALCARLADDVGIRALAIKGPALAMQRLRAERVSSDVDIWVDPADFERFIQALQAVGWRGATPYSGPFLTPPHSVDLLHDQWPVGIDLHRFFPGFLDAPDLVFEVLWDRRLGLQMAGVPILTCDPVGHTAIAALHLMRSDPDDHAPALGDLRLRASEVLGTAGLQELVKLASQTDAVATLGPFLRNLGVELDPGILRHPEEFDRWTRARSAPTSMSWVVHFSDLPLAHWPRALWHAVMLTEDELRERFGPRSLGLGVARLRWMRLRSGVRTVPPAVGAYLRQRGRLRSRR